MTAQPIVFPDTAALVISYVRAQFRARHDGVKVGRELPTPTPDEFVRIFRTGGISTFLVVDSPQLTVETYARNSGRAHDLAQFTKAFIYTMTGTTQSGVAFYGVVEFTGPQDFPDPITNQPRYSFSLQVSVRGSTA